MDCAQHAAALARRVEDGLDQGAGGGLAVRAGDTDDLDETGRPAVEVVGKVLVTMNLS